jgi:putative tryptophan/tyrosine transport system substrate-binding protein
MDRRAFLGTLAGGLLAAPLAAGAQQAGKVYRVGYLGNFPPTQSTAPVLSAFTDGLREHGYVEGRNLKLEYRWAHGRSDILPALVRELVHEGVQVVVTAQTPNALALKEHAKDLPVVLMGASHPVEAGLVQSLARPGGNITGLSSQLGDLSAKMIQLCRELVPGVSRLAVFWMPTNQASALGLKTLQAEALKAGIPVVPVSTRMRNETDAALSTLARERPDVVLVDASYIASPELPRIREFAISHRMPTVGDSNSLTRDGLLMSYSPDLSSLFHRAASFVDKILKGTKPADLPIEQPTTFELVINLKTAKALGLTIPPSLLQRADQVIE